MNASLSSNSGSELVLKYSRFKINRGGAAVRRSKQRNGPMVVAT